MSDLIQNIGFAGSGLDSDSSNELVRAGDSRARRNVMPPIDGFGTLENVWGSTLLDHGWETGGTIASVLSLGYAEDTENDKLYYFLQGTVTGGDNLNSIVEFDPIAETFVKVIWEDAELEFEDDTRIKDAKVIDGWIYYNGFSYGLKKVNITLAKNYTDYERWIEGLPYSVGNQRRVQDGRVYENITETGELPITSSTNATPIEITSTAHGYVTGTRVRVKNHEINTGANGDWAVTYVDANKFTLDGSVGNGVGGNTGTVVDITDPRNSAKWEVIANTYSYPANSSGEVQAISFSRMNIPPTTPITWSYDDDTDKLINNLRKKTFQFTYRYKYRDNGYSRTAPISTLAISPDEESYQGEILNDITKNNKLTLAFSEGNLGVIEWVELFVREGNAGSWNYARRFTEGESTYDFYNDLALEVVDDTLINTIIDAIPKQSKAQEYISENVMLLGGNTEGFDDIELDVTLTAGFDEVALTTPGAIHDTFTITETLFDRFKLNGKFNIDSFPSGTVAGDYIDIYIESNNPSFICDTNFVFVNAGGGGSELADFKYECIAAINAAASGVTASASDTGFSNFDNADFTVIVYGADAGTTYATSYIKSYAAATGEPNKWTGFKTGATHPLGIVYYDDEFRPFAVMASDDTKVYMPTIPEEYGDSTPDNLYKYKSKIGWAISHVPPAEAAYWQWYYAGNSGVANFWTYTLSSATGAKNTTADYDTAGTVYTTLDISPLIDVKTIYPQSELAYTFQKGDRVRVLTTASVASNTMGPLMATADITDLEIITYSDTHKRIVVAYDAGLWDAGNSSLIEIYRPKAVATEGTIYYGIGPVYDTYTDSDVLYHRGSSQDQDSGNDAEGSLTRGDVYFITRAFSEAVAGGGSAETVYLVEAPSYSDFYESDDYDYGKINIESDLGEVELTDIRESYRYLQDTSINGLCSYDASDYTSMPEKNGQIRAMRQVGDLLHVYQEDKSVSVWIGRQEYVDTTGNSTVATSDSILGSYREQVIEYGTINPESVTKNEQYVYGFDLMHGVFWRDGSNGLFPISEGETEGSEGYKMKTFFTDKASDLLDSGVANIDVITEWDDKLGLLYVTFLDTDDITNNETLAFHERTNRWFSFYDHWADSTPDLYVDSYMRYKNKFFAFRTGDLFRMNSTSTPRATFFATKHDVILDAVINNDPLTIKLFDQLGIYTDGDWTVDSIEVAASQSYPNGMVSEIPAVLFEEREGIQLASFLRNKKTSSSTASDVDLYEGEELRGRTMYIKMSNTSTSEVKVFAIEVASTKSNI